MRKLACTKENAKKLIADLGDTADKVAKALRRRKIKGYRRNPNYCPIAMYLGTRLNARSACVGSRSATVYCNDSSAVAVSLPPQVISFISQFDNDSYTDLQAETGTIPRRDL